MANQDKEIFKIEDPKKYKKWINEQDWYQRIHLKNGLSTKANLKTDLRIDWFNQFDFSNKTVLDIGCNSGQYSFHAKKKGARSVTGIDIDEKGFFAKKFPDQRFEKSTVCFD